jgi:hypothetical protein
MENWFKLFFDFYILYLRIIIPGLFDLIKILYFNILSTFSRMIPRSLGPMRDTAQIFSRSMDFV